MKLRDVRNLLLLAYDDDDIDDDEFCLLYDLNKSRDDYDYSRNGRFDLENLDDATSWSFFRFYKPDIYRLCDVLEIPDPVITYNRLKVYQVEAMCKLLKRAALTYYTGRFYHAKYHLSG